MHKVVLVIDDENAIKDLIVTLINDEPDYKAVGVESATKALELIESVNFDLIILDLQMPAMDGNEFLEELTKVNPALPVVVLSANLIKLTPHHQVKATIAKPFHIDQLLTVLGKHTA